MLTRADRRRRGRRLRPRPAVGSRRPTANRSSASRDGTCTAEQLVGNVALVANFGRPATDGPRHGQEAAAKQPTAGARLEPSGVGMFRFADWTVSRRQGRRPRRPRASGRSCSRSTRSRGSTLKLTAQMPPLGDDDVAEGACSSSVRIASRPTIHPQARTATFRIDDFEAKSDVPYRRRVRAEVEATRDDAISSRARSAASRSTSRRSPSADVSCNIHAAFPNDRYVEHMRKSIPISWRSSAISSTNRRPATA